jgi:hypothetical protein
MCMCEWAAVGGATAVVGMQCYQSLLTGLQNEDTQNMRQQPISLLGQAALLGHVNHVMALVDASYT